MKYHDFPPNPASQIAYTEKKECIDIVDIRKKNGPQLKFLAQKFISLNLGGKNRD